MERGFKSGPTQIDEEPKKLFTVIVATGVLTTLCARSEDQLPFGQELREGLLEIQRNRQLSDQEMVAIMEAWYSKEQIELREDLWGPGGMEAFAKKLIKDSKDGLNSLRTMGMLGGVYVLEYLNKNDVEGAKEYLRSNLAHAYREEVRLGTSVDDSLMVKVRKLAESDEELKRLMDKQSDGEPAAAGEPAPRPESK